MDRIKPQTITIPAGDDLARLYEQASPETQQKVQMLFNILLYEMLSPDAVPLNELMDMISEKAYQRGLTPEILDGILY